MTVRRLIVSSALFALILLQATSAAAVSITVGRVTETGTVTWELTDPANAASTLSAPDAEGVRTWDLTAPFVKANYTVDSMTVELKEDPFVNNNITLTNISGVTQTFVVIVSLPIPAFPYDATIASSVGVSVTNNVGTSATVSSVSPDGIYSGTVNGSGILTLMPHLTTVTCGTAGCSNTGSDLTAVPQLAAIAGVASTIGITLKFSLTAFDSVAITSRFEIINVPEPASVALLAMGFVAIALIGRRRGA